MGGISRLTNGMVSFITVIQRLIHPLTLSLTSNKPSLTLTVPSSKELAVKKSEISLDLSLTNNKPSLELTVKRKEILTINVCKK